MVSEADLQNMSPEEVAEYQKKNCVFCKIIAGEIPSKVVFEDDSLSAILDINPATKGHTLMMTKEHFPILPLIPKETSAHMFRITKHMVKALKSAMVTNNATVFIANGAVAGQQSPHFLYHLIPREEGDGLDNFNVPSNEFKEEEVKQHLASLKGKVGLMMREYKGKQPEEQQTEPSPEKPSAIEQKDLAKYIDENPNIKDMIVNNPEEFKKELENNPELKKMFQGINIAKLSIALGNLKK